jgi:hypothetical protein
MRLAPPGAGRLTDALAEVDRLGFNVHRLNAWKRQAGRVELAWSAGHQVPFPGLRMYPESFPMRLFLSVCWAPVRGRR